MKYDGSRKITCPQLLKLIEYAGIGNGKKAERGPLRFAHNGGNYLGSPGKEIYFALPGLSEEEVEKVVVSLSKQFPKKPPGNHVKWAACIRYVYGCFEKQGCLRSEKDKQRMVAENADWSVSDAFMEKLKKTFELQNNQYGLVIWYEMVAHRFGDLALIHPEKKNEHLRQMVEYYEMSQKIATQIKSLKHMFTPFYWAGHYFFEAKDYVNSQKYHTLSLKMMNKICPDSRPGYRDKAKVSLEQLKVCMGDQYKDWFINFKKKVKNKCLKKVV